MLNGLTSPLSPGTLQTSAADVWYLKEIPFDLKGKGTAKKLKIITQNYNGYVTCLVVCTLPLISLLDLARSLPSVSTVTVFWHGYGPDTLIITGNILILRGDIVIEPENRVTVSYEFLCQLVGEYLLTNCPGVDVSAALSIMPLTQSMPFAP
jgi:ubiquitin carboxyl-terminal hydrolase MINDY-1/2